MGVLEELIIVNDEGDIVSNKWIEWKHNLIPNKPEWLRIILQNLMALLSHCIVCSTLDGCYFVERNMPSFPLHDKCDCNKKDIAYSNVKNKAISECDIRKFTDYIFADNLNSKGKNKIFYDMGFTKDDATYLKNEFCKQSLEAYLRGDYILKNLDYRGQRLAIPIKLNGYNFYSGWMMYPEGKIKNTTPFGGWFK